METFGRLGDMFHNFLTMLQNLARRRDAVLGLPKGNYVNRWLPQINAVLNRALARQLFDAMYASQPTSSASVPPSSFIAPEDERKADSFYGQTLFPVEEWRALFRQQTSNIETVTPRVASELFAPSLRTPNNERYTMQAPNSPASQTPFMQEPVLPLRVPSTPNRRTRRSASAPRVSPSIHSWFSPKAMTD